MKTCDSLKIALTTIFAFCLTLSLAAPASASGDEHSHDHGHPHEHGHSHDHGHSHTHSEAAHAQPAQGEKTRVDLVLEAAHQNEFDKLKALIKEEPSLVNSTNSFGRTPLHETTIHGSTDMAEWLIKEGASVNLKDQQGQTPLHLISGCDFGEQVASCADEHVKISLEEQTAFARLLISNKSEINLATHQGWTPLHGAIIRGNKALVELLVDHGADINAKGPNQITPIVLALANRPLAEYFHEKGAEMDVFTALYLDKLEYIDSRLKTEPEIVHTKNENGASPMHYAVLYGNTNAATFLLKNKGDINSTDQIGATPLHWSITGSTNMVAWLVKNGADVNAKNISGSTPLHEAAANGRLDVVQLLLENGGNINTAATDGATPLHWACINGHEEVAKFLLQRKADTDARITDGSTPLQWAKLGGHSKIVELLGSYTNSVSMP